ncbi:MAG: hypothetical protein WKG07_20335 [Hymenobacter sp.]
MPVCFVSIKPSPARLHLRGRRSGYANAAIAQRVAAARPLYFLNLHDRMLDGRGTPAGPVRGRRPAPFAAGLCPLAAGNRRPTGPDAPANPAARTRPACPSPNSRFAHAPRVPPMV